MEIFLGCCFINSVFLFIAKEYSMYKNITVGLTIHWLDILIVSIVLLL